MKNCFCSLTFCVISICKSFLIFEKYHIRIRITDFSKYSLRNNDNNKNDRIDYIGSLLAVKTLIQTSFS